MRDAVIRRLRLRRGDGQIYLDRWGLGTKRLGGIYLHRMTAPDPGIDLHDHPWWFCSLILRGGYTEVRADTRSPHLARTLTWGAGSIHSLGLQECHKIVVLKNKPTWTLVLRGPIVRKWGFYEPGGWVWHRESDHSRRDLQTIGNKPWEQ